jgi:hypothetical protein
MLFLSLNFIGNTGKNKESPHKTTLLIHLKMAREPFPAWGTGLALPLRGQPTLCHNGKEQTGI